MDVYGNAREQLSFRTINEFIHINIKFDDNVNDNSNNSNNFNNDNNNSNIGNNARGQKGFSFRTIVIKELRVILISV